MSIESIELWHRRARPTPTEENFSVQLGCHFEEFAEMLAALRFVNGDGSHRRGFFRLQELVTDWADVLKDGTYQAAIADDGRDAFLDSLADQIVTAIGVGHCAGMQTSEAVRRVDRSNWSKFDADGLPIFDANGKIAKPSTYRPPDLGGLY